MHNGTTVRKAAKRTSFMLMLLMVCVMMMGAGSAFASGGLGTTGTTNVADGTTTIVVPSQDSTALSELGSTLKTATGALTLEAKPKQQLKSTELLTISNNGVVFNYADFEKSTNRSQKSTMKAFVTALQDSTVSEQTQQSIIDQMQATSPDVARLLIPMVMDSTSADLYTAMKWLAPILPFVRILFGVGAILISLFLVGSTILDIIYIGLPFFRERISSGKDGGGGGGKPGMITMDAYSVVQEVESSIGGNGGYKNAYLLYFKRRAFSYILIGFCLLYLVVGELGGLIGWIMQIGTGVLPA